MRYSIGILLVFYWERSFIVYEIRKTLSAGINEIRSRGVVSQHLLFIFASCCWAPHVTTAAAVGLSAWALATRPRRSPWLPASVQQRKGLLQARTDQFAAWEEEEKAALADVRSGRRIHSTRRFGSNENSYLHVACKHGDLSACELLLQMPLYSGMWATPAADHVHVQWHVGELHMNARGRTALHFAAQSGSAAVVSLLLEAQLVDVDARAAYNDGPGRTPLHEAALKGHVEAARVLLEHGCHIGLPCGFEDETPLAFAIENGHLRLVQLLCTPTAPKYGGTRSAGISAVPQRRRKPQKRGLTYATGCANVARLGAFGGRCITWKCSRLHARSACYACATSAQRSVACMCAQSGARATVLIVSKAVRRAPSWVTVRGASAPSSS